MSELKKQMRLAIPSIQLKSTTSVEEKFQNDVIRPIIKLQHDLIITCFINFLERKKVELNSFNETQKVTYLQKLFKTNMELKTELRSLIIGLFTLEEYKEYLNLKPQLNKRINTIIQNRIGSIYVLN
tara:strand:- start:605 stop:985 length:381 start_codon:yes stop_codon:yes gene_type:complete